MIEKHISQPSWYVFYTASRQEKKAAELLSKRGYDVFLPLITEMKQWSDRKKKVKSPLFKSYLFVSVLPMQIQTVCGFPGIVSAVKVAGKYATIKPSEIEAIQMLVESGIYAEAVPGKINEGDQVVINEGPLKGMSGICVLSDSHNYFFVEVPSINHMIKVKIHQSAIKKID